MSDKSTWEEKLESRCLLRDGCLANIHNMTNRMFRWRVSGARVSYSGGSETIEAAKAICEERIAYILEKEKLVPPAWCLWAGDLYTLRNPVDCCDIIVREQHGAYLVTLSTEEGVLVSELMETLDDAIEYANVCHSIAVEEYSAVTEKIKDRCHVYLAVWSE